MKSVISAFQTKKTQTSNTTNEKHSVGSNTLINLTNNTSSKKKSLNVQENGYQYLRHLREIETVRKLPSPIVAGDNLLESEKFSFRPVPCVDVVDHHAPICLSPNIDVHLNASDCNMNSGMEDKCGVKPIIYNETCSLENGNYNENDSANRASAFDCQTVCPQNLLSYNSLGGSPDLDDDESEISNTVCTSSSSDQSNSTVVLHSPTNTESTSEFDNSEETYQTNSQQKCTGPRPTSPFTSLTEKHKASATKEVSTNINSNTPIPTPSLSSNTKAAANSPLIISTNCSLINSLSPLNSSLRSPPPVSPALLTTDTKIVESAVGSENESYVPVFLKSTPKTLPIIMPNCNSSLASVPYHPGTTSINSASNTPKHSRYSKPRLSLSAFINQPIPLVHGRPNLKLINGSSDTSNTASSVGNNSSKRISTHQRNLSLDFRSMGILLPPVSQVTNPRINLTQHHRNRSLDSALQRIPEVEVSSPNAESENTFCTPSILSSTMCSKIVTTAANVTAALTTTTTPSLTLTNNISEVALTDSSPGDINSVNSCLIDSSCGASDHKQHISNIRNETVTTKAPTPSQYLNLPLEPYSNTEHCHPERSRLKYTKDATISSFPLNNNGNSPSSIVATTSNSTCARNTNGKNVKGIVNTNGKKREDLTSLGSDDSGIICGSDSDQISLNRIRHSHESLDSGEIDAEEECIDVLETTSMDEEYNILQQDFCFFPTSDIDCRTLRPSRKKHPKDHEKKCDSARSNETSRTTTAQETDSSTFNENGRNANIVKDDMTERKQRYRGMNMSQEATSKEHAVESPTPTLPLASETPCDTVDTIDSPTSTASLTPTATSNTLICQSPSSGATSIPSTSSGKAQNDVLFKLIFGATKNAIFRTAQSIIENHEKKNAAKNQKSEDQSSNSLEQVKSPTDFSKKKEFFGLISSHSSKKAAAAAAAAAAASHVNATIPTFPIGGSIALDSNYIKTITLPDKSSNVENNETIRSNFALPTSSNLNLNSNSNDDDNSSNQPHAFIGEDKSCNQNLQDNSNGGNNSTSMSKSSSISSLHKLKVPGVVKCFIKERSNTTETAQQKTEKGPSGLLRFFESPVFNIHFAIHYLFYSKEPGVLSFIGNKIFSFPDQEVDLYIPQLIVMYIQMDELAEVLDPYLTIRCRKSVDFSLKCLWLLEAYNYQVDTLGNSSTGGRKNNLALMKELFSKKERKIVGKIDGNKETKITADIGGITITPTIRKTHHRSQSDATVLLAESRGGSALSISKRSYQQPPYTTQTLPTTPAKLCLGDLTSGRAFDNGCTCFETVRGQVNGLLGQKTVCSCSAPKTAPQKEFMKALINVGKNLTSLPSKAEKTSALRMFLNLINKNLPARVWIPLYSDIPHHVVRITEEKTAVLNSKDKTPYIIYIEVVEVPDIYSSPLIPKMMPSLRHTKSEEHLDGACIVGSIPHITCSRTSSCSSRGGIVVGGSNTGNGNGNGLTSSTAGINFNTNSILRRKKEKLTSESSSIASDQNNSFCHGVPVASDLSCSPCNNHLAGIVFGGLHLTEDDVWSQEDDEITAQYLNLRKVSERDAISQMSLDSCDSRDQGMPVLFNIGDVRTRHCNNLNCENTKSFSNDPEDPSAAALKEPWHEKEKQIRESSPYGHLSNWRLLSAIVKCGDDLRQELMATQLLQMFKIIWQEEKVDLWVRPYKIVCLSNDSGLIEPILNTVSLHQIKKNSNKSLRDYFIDEYGSPDGNSFRSAQKNFVQSCAAYCLISYLLQVKDRHNGNILLHSDGHIIHIDFGFILSISPKNLGFEQSPFKLTHEFVDVMGGTQSEHWREFNRLLLIGMMSARKHMDRIINFVEIMRSNAQLPCFKNGCSGTVQNLRKRFHMNLTEQEMERKVEQLVQDSLKSLSTKLYDGYQYYTNGIL